LQFLLISFELKGSLIIFFADLLLLASDEFFTHIHVLGLTLMPLVVNVLATNDSPLYALVQRLNVFLNHVIEASNFQSDLCQDDETGNQRFRNHVEKERDKILVLVEPRPQVAIDVDPLITVSQLIHD
jgi:hypothetical protein